MTTAVQELLDANGNVVDSHIAGTFEYARRFLETSYTNNTAWTSFKLSRDSSGNAKIAIVGHSPCATVGLCGENAPNR